MLRSRMIPSLAVMVLALSQASCVTSVNPLEDPEKCTLDERLVGVWKSPKAGKNPDSPQYVYFLIGRATAVEKSPDALMVTNAVAFFEDQSMTAGEAGYFFALKLADNDYLQFLNLSEKKLLVEWDQATVKSYSFYKYQVSHAKLTLWPLEQTVARRAVEAGDLKGTIKEKQDYTDIRLTEPTDGLRRYIGSDRGKALFPDDHDDQKLILKRVD
jgi:hypothetical protein